MFLLSRKHYNIGDSNDDDLGEHECKLSLSTMKIMKIKMNMIIIKIIKIIIMFQTCCWPIG